jgi:hypothetical protein
LRQLVSSQWFALTDLLLVLWSGWVWMIYPEMGPWSVLIALFPLAFRTIAGKSPFQRTLFDWPIAIFLLTVWVGYWVSYDKAAAWNKAWLIVLAVLLYYALSAQPRQNWIWVSIIFFLVGIGVSVYFFLTYDFANTSGRLALWWLDTRPQFGWPAIHHAYICGVVVITMLVASYGIWQCRTFLFGGRWVLLSWLFFSGLGIDIGAFTLTSSRGMWLALAAALGIWILWKVITSSRFSVLRMLKSVFPFIILIYLAMMIFFVYIGPGGLDYSSEQSVYGSNTRSDLFLRGVLVLEDVPILGGGLNSFPGLYSQYMLGIPIFYFANSYNLFLDVAIEQGLAGGLILMLLYFGSAWHLSKTIVTSQVAEIQTFSWLALFTLVFAIIQGMIYDYLYNGIGVILLLFPVGIAMIGILNTSGLKQNNAKGVSVSVFAVSIVLITLSVINLNLVRAIWYANLGVIQMAQVELAGFPTDKWTEPTILPDLETAEASFRSALHFDPANRTANHRLGLIAMLRQDFDAAINYLEVAHEQAPEHRGIIKALGYSYVWLGEVERAQMLLSEIPEAEHELSVYDWWWEDHGRDDLSANAALMASRFESAAPLP